MKSHSSHRRPGPPELELIELDWDDMAEIPSAVDALLQDADARLQAYWDQWHRRPIEQYVACDFRDVWRAMKCVADLKLADGKLFCEWGCGFGVVAGMASLLGWDAVGIEAESFLVNQAREFLKAHEITAEIWHGNFLPPGSERLAALQSDHASLFHQVPDAYRDHDLQLEDFSIVFAYPWPGEHHFLREVFRHYARENALLLMFLGPYEIELYRRAI